MPSNPLSRLRKICLALPGAHEVEAWGEPTFRVVNKLFAMHASPSNHHGFGRQAVWCKAAPANQQLMIQANPARFFSPPYVGPGGWIGIWLDGEVDWNEVGELMADAYGQIVAKLPKSKQPIAAARESLAKRKSQAKAKAAESKGPQRKARRALVKTATRTRAAKGTRRP